LFVGKLIEKKRAADLLKAFFSIQDPRAHLVVVGDGALRDQLVASVPPEKRRQVHFAGFQNQLALPRFYVAADVFVLPSGVGETWGLVVNEAMNFELPVITSDLVGCAADLVDEGQNGFIYPVGDTDALTARMREMMDCDLPAMGKRSAEIVQDYSYDAVVRGIRTAAGLMAAPL
jgi:glycosyltransferase involved in cell wall biosynthesis